MTVLHSTEPATVYLSLHARVDGLTVPDVDRALYDDRSVVKQLAMRRTLFVFPRDLLPAAWGSASLRVAAQLEARLVKELESAGHADGAALLAEARSGVLDVLRGTALTAQEIRQQVPVLESRLDLAQGTKYAANVSIAPRVLTQLGVEGLVVRGRNAGHWRISKPRWALMSEWLDDVPAPAKADEGYAELVGRWLRTFGPGTEERHRVVARRDEGRGPRRARRRGGGRGLPGRRRDGLGAARRRRGPRRRRRAVGGAAARPRPDRDGLEAARLLPRRARSRSSSTGTATPGPRRGGTGGSSAAGCRTTRAWSSCGCWRTCPGPRTPRWPSRRSG